MIRNEPVLDDAFRKANREGPGHLENKERLVLWEAARLDDLTYFTGVRELVLYGSTFTAQDLHKLTALPLLTSLDISKCTLPDLHVLGELRQLTALKLTNLTLTDSSLPTLSPRLETVTICLCGINSIESLRGCRKITSLELQSNLIEDISPLEGMRLLQTLNLTGNRIRTLEPLKGLTALESLHLDDNLIEDISALSTLTALTSLFLSSNRIEEISALCTLKKLTVLSLSRNRIEDISVLRTLTALTALYLDDNRIQDISVLASLVNLESVRLRNNRILDLRALCALPELHDLDLRGNAIKDVTPLANLPKIVKPNIFSWSSYKIEIPAVADKSTLLQKPLYGLFEECLDYPELEPESSRKQRPRKTNPRTAYLANVHPRVHFCRNAMLVELKGGEHRIRVRNIRPYYNSDFHYPLYLDRKLLADVFIPDSDIDGSVETGCGDGVFSDAAVHEALNAPFTGLKHMVPALHPLLRLLETGLYLAADFDLFPAIDDSRDGFTHFWDAPEYGEQIHFDRFYESAFSWDTYDAPLYLFPTRRAGDMDAALVRRYEERLVEGDAFPRCVALFLNGCVSLLIDGHHKAAAAAAQGKPVKTIVIFRVQDEDAVRKAIEHGERLYLMHQDKQDKDCGPLLIKNGAGDLLSPVCFLKNEKKHRLYIGRYPEEHAPWGRIPEEFKQRLGEYLSNDTLLYGTRIPIDGMRTLVQELKEHAPPERMDDEDEELWLQRCIDWYLDKDHTVRELKKYLKLHPDTKWITAQERQRIEELSETHFFSKMGDAFLNQYMQYKRSQIQRQSLF